MTALGTALVTAGSAQAASMSVSASTSIFFNGQDNSNYGNGWSMTDSISFTASGEMDNGWTVSTSLGLDGQLLMTEAFQLILVIWVNLLSLEVVHLDL